MRESKPWHDKPRLPPPRGYLRSECYVDLGNGREEPIADWVPITVDKVKDLLNESAKRPADVLTLLRSFYGGEAAAARRRVSWERTWSEKERDGYVACMQERGYTVSK